MSKTPFFYLVILLSAGLISGYFIDRIPFAILSVSLFFALFLFCLFLSDRRIGARNALLLFLISVFGFFYYEGRTRIYPGNHIRELAGFEEKIGILGDVRSLPDKREKKVFFEFESRSLINDADTIPLCGKIRVTFDYGVNYGDRLILYGRLRSPSSPSNPNEFDYRSWLARRNIYVTMFPDSIKKVGDGFGNRGILLVARVRDYIEGTVNKNIGGTPGAFLKGITIGQRGQIPKEVQEVFKNTGVIHILAVSGLHVGIIAGILFVIVSLFRPKVIVKVILVSTFLVLYAFMIDLRPSVVRATVMTILLMIGIFGKKETDVLNTLCIAAFFILIWNPQSLFDVSFQLSFGATASIIYLYPKIYPLVRVRKGYVDNILIKPLTVSLCAQAGTTFLIAHYFYRFPIISLVANLIVIPLTGLCITTGFLLFFVNLIGIDLLTGIFASAAYGTSSLTLNIVRLFGKIPYGHFWIKSPSPLFLFFYFFLLVTGANLLYPLIKKRTFNISLKPFIYGVISAALLLIGTNLYRAYNPEITMTFMDVGMGNSTLLQMGSDVVLIDGGGSETPTTLLRSKGIRDISIIFLSSPLSYDVRGLEYVIENFNVKGVVLPFIPYNSWTYRRFLNALKQRNIPHKFVRAGDEIGPFKVKNSSDGASNVKDASLVLVFEGGVKQANECKALFLGEVETNIRDVVEKAHIVRAPYFGGYRDPSFLELVQPELTVISVGRNRWGLPDSVMIENYKRYGRVVRTDKDGACIVKIGMEGISIKTIREKEEMRENLKRWMGLCF